MFRRGQSNSTKKHVKSMKIEGWTLMAAYAAFVLQGKASLISIRPPLGPINCTVQLDFEQYYRIRVSDLGKIESQIAICTLI